MSTWLENRWAYLSLVLALVVPGLEPFQFPDRDEEPGDLADWDDENLKLLIEEGRRQFDRQARLLDGIRVRSQWLFTTGLAVIAVLVGRAAPLQLRPPTLVDTLVFLGLICTVYAVLGSAALLVVAARFGVIDVGDLSREAGKGSMQAHLARQYASAVRPGETTLRTRLTLFFESAVWLMVGAASAAALYIVY